MPWVILVIAGLLEIGWAIGLKYTHGFTRFWPSLFTGVLLVSSVGLLSYAARTLPIGTAYAVWVGIGSLGLHSGPGVLRCRSRKTSCSAIMKQNDENNFEDTRARGGGEHTQQC